MAMVIENCSLSFNKAALTFSRMIGVMLLRWDFGRAYVVDAGIYSIVA